MEAFRISNKKWSDHLSGKGAALKGARWNSIGTEIIYTATNRSLAMAEVAVHLPVAMLSDEFLMVTIFIPDDTPIRIVQSKDLPINWNTFPHIPACQTFGDEFINENKFCILKIPSAVTQGDFNLLINPFHADFVRIKVVEIVPFPFDHRIFK